MTDADTVRHEWSESHDPPVVRLMLILHRAEALAFAAARAVWDAHGLAPAEFDVLATLRNAPPPHELTPSQLQASLLITSGGLTKVMRQLEARALVSRPAPRADMRVKPMRLAPAGKRLVERAMRDLAATSGSRVRAALDENEIETLSELLRQLARDRAS